MIVMFSAWSAAAECTRSAKGAEVCGSGDEAVTILTDTKSPSGTLAIGWRIRKGTPPSVLPDPRFVEEYVVRLPDGKILSRAVGRAWNDGEMQSNKIEVVTAWSPSENWLIVCDTGQEALVDLAVYAVDVSAGAAVEKNLLEHLNNAAATKLMGRVGKDEFKQYELQIPEEAKISVSDTGKVQLPIRYHIPKQDQRFDFAVTFTISQKDRALAVSKIDVRAR